MQNDRATVTKPAADGAGGPEYTRSGRCYRPNVDILEKDNELLVLADVPGAKGDKIAINFEDGTLSIHAEVEPRQDNHDYLLCEYGVGDYYRSFRVSEVVDASKITAEYADGVLVLHLPKTEDIKTRKIAVET